MLTKTATIAPGGRLIIPAAFRKKMDLAVGDEVILKFTHDMIQVFNVHHAVQHAQNLVKQYNPKRKSIVSELLQERKAESKHG